MLWNKIRKRKRMEGKEREGKGRKGKGKEGKGRSEGISKRRKGQKNGKEKERG